MNNDTLQVARNSFELLKAGLAGSDEALHQWLDTLTDDVLLWLPATPRTSSPYRGKQAVADLFLGFIGPMWRPHGLHLQEPRVFTDGGNQVSFQVQDSGTRSDGSSYQNTVVITLQVRDGKIARFWEYWGGPNFFAE
jgi:ketosteroid isomerase-like protein